MTVADGTSPQPGFWRRAWLFALELWDVLRRPSSVFSLGVLVLAGFVAGVIFWGGFNTALELTNTEKFCISLSRDARQRVRRSSRPRSISPTAPACARRCPDCHVPARVDRQDRPQDAGLQGGVGPSVRHHRHAREVSRAPARARFCTNGRGMKANDSLECRNCHSAESMDITKQSPRAADAHRAAACSPARRPASTATRASRTGCPTCGACRAGSSRSGTA